MLTLDEFRELVRKEFGPHLERATPASVREFLDRLHLRMHRESGEGSPYTLDVDDRARSYEEIVAGFFSRVLDYPPDQAVIMLWLLAFEQHFAILEEDYSRRSLSLFGEVEPD
ncbi:MAG: hypothetical protein JSV79_06040 [Armatimonadota bacterium]|nr:MAG: hypothetical protein JSV79_06040 [Armatimonadota bacterium]